MARATAPVVAAFVLVLAGLVAGLTGLASGMEGAGEDDPTRSGSPLEHPLHPGLLEPARERRGSPLPSVDGAAPGPGRAPPPPLAPGPPGSNPIPLQRPAAKARAPSVGTPLCERPGTRILPDCERWVARYDGPAEDADDPQGEWARELVVAPDGSTVYVTGESRGDGTGFDYATGAWDAQTGDRIWLSRYDGPAGGSDEAGSIVVSSDGSRLFVAGHSAGPGSSWDYAIVAYDARTGKELWVARYDGPERGAEVAVDHPWDMAMAPDGSSVYVTGWTRGNTGVRLVAPHDYQTLALDAATGEREWVAWHDGPVGGIDAASRIAASPNGFRVYVTGGTDGDGTGNDVTTVAYNATTGALVWKRTFHRTFFDVGYNLISHPGKDRLYLLSFDLVGSGATVVAYDGSTGKPLWTAQHATDFAFGLALDPDGERLFVSGEQRNSVWTTYYDVETWALDADTGDELWEATYSNGLLGFASIDQITRTETSPDGSRVYVIGHSSGIGSDPERQEDFAQDFLTLAYDASSGEKVWAKRYNGPDRGVDRSHALGVNPDGSQIFVAGESGGRGTGQDYALVAYGADPGITG